MATATKTARKSAKSKPAEVVARPLPKLPYVVLRGDVETYAAHTDDPRESLLRYLNSSPGHTRGIIPTGEQAAWIRDGLSFLQNYPEQIAGEYAVVVIDPAGQEPPVLEFAANSVGDCSREQFIAARAQPDRQVIVFAVPSEKVCPRAKPVEPPVPEQAKKEAAAKRLTKLLGKDGKVEFDARCGFPGDEGSHGNLLVLWPAPSEHMQLPALDYRAGNLEQQAIDALREMAEWYAKAAAKLEAKMKAAKPGKKRKAA